MQISDIDICNMALANIGQANSIQSLRGAGISERSCAMRYAEARRECLSSYLWNFASLWREGDRLDIKPKAAWSYCYLYPPDALKVFEIERRAGSNELERFEVTARPDQDGRLIQCNHPNPVFIYVKDITDPAQYSQEFVNAMAWLLASKIAMPITKSKQMQNDAFKMFLSEISAAKASSANEGVKEFDFPASYQDVY